MVMVLLWEIARHLIKKWARENPGIEISLWLEKEKNEKGKVLSLKYKTCIKFEGELNRISTLKKTWLNGNTEGRLIPLKYHCTSKLHMKALRSFTALVLKMLVEVDQKELTLSPDEFKRIKSEVIISYFVAKTDIL